MEPAGNIARPFNSLQCSAASQDVDDESAREDDQWQSRPEDCAAPKSESQTAAADGEDLLTPIVMRTAEAIVTRGGHK
jgi:hypothetical protein